MLRNAVFFAIMLLVVGCKTDKNTDKTISIVDINTNQYQGFGSEVVSNQILNKRIVAETYEELKEGDTVAVTFMSTVNDVCKVKGCWMKVAMGNDKETMVKFKDYGFFVPKDIEKDTVIMQGRAFVSETSVDELRHYAEDAGKSQEEIAAITKPKKTYSFIADGVLVKN